MLPHEVIHYLVATGCVTVQEVANLTGRHDQNLGSKKNAFCDKHLLDNNVCIALGFHGDGVPFQKATLCKQDMLSQLVSFVVHDK